MLFAAHALKKYFIQSGATRVNGEALEAVSDELENHIDKVAKLAQKYAAHAKRKTITQDDIELALEHIRGVVV